MHIEAKLKEARKQNAPMEKELDRFRKQLEKGEAKDKELVNFF